MYVAGTAVAAASATDVKIIIIFSIEVCKEVRPWRQICSPSFFLYQIFTADPKNKLLW